MSGHPAPAAVVARAVGVMAVAAVVGVSGLLPSAPVSRPHYALAAHHHHHHHGHGHAPGGVALNAATWNQEWEAAAPDRDDHVEASQHLGCRFDGHGHDDGHVDHHVDHLGVDGRGDHHHDGHDHDRDHGSDEPGVDHHHHLAQLLRESEELSMGMRLPTEPHHRQARHRGSQPVGHLVRPHRTSFPDYQNSRVAAKQRAFFEEMGLVFLPERPAITFPKKPPSLLWKIKVSRKSPHRG